MKLRVSMTAYSPLRVLLAGRVCPMRWTTKPLKSRAVTALYYKMTNEGLYLDKFMFFQYEETPAESKIP